MIDILNNFSYPLSTAIKIESVKYLENKTFEKKNTYKSCRILTTTLDDDTYLILSTYIKKLSKSTLKFLMGTSIFYLIFLWHQDLNETFFG